MTQQTSNTISKTELIDIAKNTLKSELMVAAIYLKLIDKFKDNELTTKLAEFAALNNITPTFGEHF